MERDDRAPVATFFHAEGFAEGKTATLGEDNAHHARVKRLAVDDPVRLTDGRGHLAHGSLVAVRRASLEVAVEYLSTADKPSPVHLCAPVADRDRMLWLAEKCAELAVTSWQSVHFHRSASVTPRGEGTAFANKLRARMVSALEQSGSAWLPELRPETRVEEIAQDDRALRILLDARGTPLLSMVPLGARRDVVVLLGPEGGLDPDERKGLLSRGWRAARLTSTTLRFETAGLAAVATLRALELGGGVTDGG